jgi:phosphoribosylformylglycinamidine cyclo-ligase
MQVRKMRKQNESKDEMTYQASGVDINRADKAISRVKNMIQSTFTSEVPLEIGSFAGLFRPDLSEIAQPLLVSSTDGVGTKLLLAKKMQKFDTVGIDLVAMVVNDILCLGAKPLFLLDYIGIGKFDDIIFDSILKGIVDGCKIAGCALIGGETAELPDMYPEGEFDLAAFGVGIVDQSAIIDGSKIREGDVIIGLPSSGFHSNGFSLVRKVLDERSSFDLTDRIPGLKKDLGNALLTPTTIYVKPVLELIDAGIGILGIANITGGGITGNVPRILPKGLNARIDPDTWKVPREMELIVEWGRISFKERYKVFNMGIGMVLVMHGGAVDDALLILKKHHIEGIIIGEIVAGKGEVAFTTVE